MSRTTVDCTLFGPDRSHYKPSAFYMYLAKGIMTGPDSFAADQFHRLMHEYTHLLQDRTSLNAVARFGHVIAAVHDLAELVESCGTKLVLPLSKTPKGKKSSIEKHLELGKTARGSSSWRAGRDWAYVRHKVRKRHCWIDDRPIHVPQAIFRFADQVSGDTCDQVVGDREIKEAFAVAVQLIAGKPTPPKGKEFQYVAVPRILSTIGKFDNLQVIAVCHWALQSTTPGVRLGQIVDYLKSMPTIPKAYGLYDKLRQHAFSLGYAAQVHSVTVALDDMVNTQARAGKREFLAKIYRWFRNDLVAALRRNCDTSRRYPLDSPVCDPRTSRSRKRILAMFDEEPVPCVESGDFGIFSIGKMRIGPEVSLSLGALLSLQRALWYGAAPEWKCPYYVSCQAKCKADDCLTHPWRRASPRPACPYGVGAHYLRLSDLHTMWPKK